jgi:phosphoribosylanthranilate isomerase
MKVKICGMRDSDNALVAARAGADFLGFVFVEGVRRQLQPPQARAIIERFRHEWAHDQAQSERAHEQMQAQQPSNGPQLVGLFRNQPADWVKHVVEQCDLDIAQLCGDEDHAYARSLGIPVLRQIRVRPDETQESLRARVEAALQAGEMVHLDRDDPKVPGGGGVAFDWRAAEGVASLPNVLLSGGLNPENVAGAIARLRPWGVDVSSGVETAGQKDPDRIRAFISTARSAAAAGQPRQNL